MYVCMEWWILFGVQSGFPLVVKPSSVGVSAFPKCPLRIILLKYLFVSFSKSFWLGFPGFGTKLRFLLSNLNCCLVKDFLVRLITYLFGSSIDFVFYFLIVPCSFANFASFC